MAVPWAVRWVVCWAVPWVASKAGLWAAPKGEWRAVLRVALWACVCKKPLSHHPLLSTACHLADPTAAMAATRAVSKGSTWVACLAAPWAGVMAILWAASWARERAAPLESRAC